MTTAISATAFCALFPLLVLLAPLLLDAVERRLLRGPTEVNPTDAP